MIDYPVLVFRTPGDGLYVADVPDLPGCSAHGETPEEALREVEVAIGLWVDVARDLGRPIPQPSNPSSLGRVAS